MRFRVANGFGDSLDSPSPDAMRAFLEGLDTTDEEHGAAWLSTDDGVVLEWSGDGPLVLDGPEAGHPRHLRGVSRERALELWLAFSRGELGEVERCAWAPGNGHVRNEAREAELREWQRRDDRAFSEFLGAERTDVPCRGKGCRRGAAAFSVLCRAHQFESVKGRSSPFHD